MQNFNERELFEIAGIGSVVYESEMTSTSDEAKAILAEPDFDGVTPLLVICDRQTAGRGQPGKSWQSDINSLTFTCCISAADIAARNQPLLSLIAGSCVCDAIRSVGVEQAKLKWPNDVLVARKKICGILVEKISATAGPIFLIGIGVNVNQSQEDINAMQVASSAFESTSARVCFGESIEPMELLGSIVSKLIHRVTSDKDWQSDFESQLDFVGQRIQFKKPDGETEEAIFIGIDSNGHAMLETANGQVSFASGHIEPIAKQ